jgi:serine/threonine protein kinase
MKKPGKIEQVGPYQVLEKLGRGGMGTVYKARHGSTGELVAVKIASSQVANHPTLRTRFRREFVVANKVSHPNLVRALDHGEENSIPYLVMELVVGEGLDKRLRDKGLLSEPDAVAVFSQVADALRYLHQNMIVHRDVKPGNILVTAEGLAKVADFGLGKELESGSALTRSHLGMGTLEYAAPEQCEDAKQVDLRCDVYSLGVAMYVALSGVYPFGTGNMYRVLQCKFNNQFSPLSSLRPAISPLLDRLISRCLNFEPDLRPASCAEVLAVLQTVGKEPSNRPPPAPALPPAAPKPPGVEKRTIARYAAELKLTCAPVARPDQRCTAILVDVSNNGLCIQTERRFETKTTLEITMQLGYDQAATTYIAQVRWVKRLSDSQWQIGCAFGNPLESEDLDDILESGSSKTNPQTPPPPV